MSLTCHLKSPDIDIHGDAMLAALGPVFALDLFLAHCGLSTERIVMMVYCWVYEVKGVHVNLSKEIDSWDTLINYNNYFHVECCSLYGTFMWSAVTAS